MITGAGGKWKIVSLFTVLSDAMHITSAKDAGSRSSGSTASHVGTVGNSTGTLMKLYRGGRKKWLWN